MKKLIILLIYSTVIGFIYAEPYILNQFNKDLLNAKNMQKLIELENFYSQKKTIKKERWQEFDKKFYEFLLKNTFLLRKFCQVGMDMLTPQCGPMN